MVKSNEFDGFICDYCKGPFTVEQASGKAWHVSTITLNNITSRIAGNRETLDFCRKTHFKKYIDLMEIEDA